MPIDQIDDAFLEMQYHAQLLALTLMLRAFNPDQPRVPAGSPDGGQWTSEGGEPSDPSPSRWTFDPADGILDRAPGGDRIGRLDDHGDASSNAETVGATVEAVQYRGRLHDEIRDDLADLFRKKGFAVATEVPVTLIGTAPITARIDILVRDPTIGLVGFEVKTGFDPTYTVAQAVVYPHLPSGGLAFSSSYKIVPFGIQPMQTLPPIKMFTFDYNVLTGRNTLKPILPEPFLPKKGLTFSELHFRVSVEQIGFEQ